MVTLLVLLGLVGYGQVGLRLGRRARKKAGEQEPSLEQFLYFPVSSIREHFRLVDVTEKVKGADGKDTDQVRVRRVRPATLPGLNAFGDEDGFWYDLLSAVFWPAKLAVNLPAWLLFGPDAVMRALEQRKQKRLAYHEQRLLDAETPDAELQEMLEAPSTRPQLPPGSGQSQDSIGPPPAELHLAAASGRRD
jgi:hypothetical protein